MPALAGAALRPHHFRCYRWQRVPVEQYANWTGGFARTLIDRLKFDPAHVTVLSDAAQEASAATAANVRKSIAAVHARMTRDDLLIVLLIGHGTSDGEAAKFNLVGPDMDLSEWASLLQPLPGPGGGREHDGRQLSFHRAPERSPPHRHLGHRFSRAAVRHGLSRVPSSARSATKVRTSTRTGASQYGRRSRQPAQQ